MPNFKDSVTYCIGKCDISENCDARYVHLNSWRLKLLTVIHETFWLKSYWYLEMWAEVILRLNKPGITSTKHLNISFIYVIVHPQPFLIPLFIPLLFPNYLFPLSPPHPHLLPEPSTFGKRCSIDVLRIQLIIRIRGLTCLWMHHTITSHKCWHFLLAEFRHVSTMISITRWF